MILGELQSTSWFGRELITQDQFFEIFSGFKIRLQLGIYLRMLAFLDQKLFFLTG